MQSEGRRSIESDPTKKNGAKVIGQGNQVGFMFSAILVVYIYIVA